MKFYILPFLFILFSGCKAPEFSEEQTLSLFEKIEKDQIPEEDLSILIDKSDYKLFVLNGSNILQEYSMVLGGDPVSQKLMQGDKCTPEGTFSIRDLYPHKSWSKFMWIDYPNEESWSNHRTAKRKGEIPDFAQIGGEVGIHGVPENCDYLIDNKQNWTLGCISLKTADINELYAISYQGMKVVIRK